MTESAYPKGFTATTVTTGDIPSWVDICQVIAAELQKIGINMNVKVVPDTTWSSMVYGHTAPNLFTYFGAGGPDPGAQPDALLGSRNVKSGGDDFADYNPRSVDELLARGDAASNPTTRLAIYGELLKKLGTDVPYVPLFNLDAFIALRKVFTIPASDRNDNFGWVVDEWPFLIKPVE
jgi:ABC-type transport system substrate-binding protein